MSLYIDARCQRLWDEITSSPDEVAGYREARFSPGDVRICKSLGARTAEEVWQLLALWRPHQLNEYFQAGYRKFDEMLHAADRGITPTLAKERSRLIDRRVDDSGLSPEQELAIQDAWRQSPIGRSMPAGAPPLRVAEVATAFRRAGITDPVDMAALMAADIRGHTWASIIATCGPTEVGVALAIRQMPVDRPPGTLTVMRGHWFPEPFLVLGLTYDEAVQVAEALGTSSEISLPEMARAGIADPSDIVRLSRVGIDGFDAARLDRLGHHGPDALVRAHQTEIEGGSKRWPAPSPPPAGIGRRRRGIGGSTLEKERIPLEGRIARITREGVWAAFPTIDMVELDRPDQIETALTAGDEGTRMYRAANDYLGTIEASTPSWMTVGAAGWMDQLRLHVSVDIPTLAEADPSAALALAAVASELEAAGAYGLDLDYQRMVGRDWHGAISVNLNGRVPARHEREEDGGFTVTLSDDRPLADRASPFDQIADVAHIDLLTFGRAIDRITQRAVAEIFETITPRCQAIIRGSAQGATRARRCLLDGTQVAGLGGRMMGEELEIRICRIDDLGPRTKQWLAREATTELATRWFLPNGRDITDDLHLIRPSPN